MSRRAVIALGSALCLGTATPAFAAERPIYLGLTTWFAGSPVWNAHHIISLTAPAGDTPWMVLTDYVPALGSGHLNIGYQFELGPVGLTPSLGYRFFASGSPSFEAGPELRLGATVQLLPWLNVWAGGGYAPFLGNPNAGGPGSYLDFTAALQANFERVSLSIGYGGLAFNPGQAGNPYGSVSMGGPTVGVLTRF